MKKLIIISLLIFVKLMASDLSIEDRISKYSGENSNELLNLYKNSDEDTKFILENCSPNDLASLKADYLIENVKFAQKARKLPFNKNYSDQIFRHFVLPHRVSQEPLERWRKTFYEEISPLVEDVKTIEEAAILVNLWVAEQMYFKITTGRDQAPLTTIKRGFGRCEESMIIYIAAARAVGIPVRPASVPFWSFTDNNHAWVEVWTENGWEYAGEAENALSRTWFTKTTRRAGLMTSRAFGKYKSNDALKNKFNSTTINSTKYYNNVIKSRIKVQNNNGDKIPDATVRFYAASYGGLFPILDLKTDKNGLCELNLGEASFYIIAAKDSLVAMKTLNILDNPNVTLTLSENKKIDTNFTLNFDLPDNRKAENADKEVLGKNFYLKRKIANLKREKRINNQDNSLKFLNFYDKFFANNFDDKYIEKRNFFLEQSGQLAGNSENFLKTLQKSDKIQQKIILKMIESWDVKDLCEIPDTTKLSELTSILSEIKGNFSIPDSLYYSNVVNLSKGVNFPQNGWQKKFYTKIKHLKTNTIEETKDNIHNFIENNTKIDSNFVFTYFSHSLNPVEILNMKYIPKFYQIRLKFAMMKYLGIPVQWKGQIEYFNGEKFVALNNSIKEEIKTEKKEILISLFVDGKKIEAKPWNNFLMAELNSNGSLNYIFFEGKEIEKSFKAKYIENENPLYVEASIRNENGDANLSIKSIEFSQNNEIKIYLNSPKEYLDKSNEWNEEIISNFKNLASDNDKKSLLFIRGEKENEPEIRMYEDLLKKSSNFDEVNFIVYSNNRKNSDLKSISKFKNHKLHSGRNFLKNKVDKNNFPVVILLDEDKNIIFSSIGYKMGIADLLLSKIK